MAMTLLATNPDSTDVATVSFTSSINSTYKLYIFKFYDINPATDNAEFSFQVNATDSTGYDRNINSTTFYSDNNEDGTGPAVQITATHDQANGTAFQPIAWDVGNGSNESCAGELFLFEPSNTTYVKQFYSRLSTYEGGNYIYDAYTSGYINDTTAIDDIQFKMSSGIFDGVIQMYGIA